MKAHVVTRVGLILMMCTTFLSGCTSPEQKATKLVESGFEELGRGEIPKAMSDFRDALQIQNKNKQALWGMALAFEKQGNFKKMFEMCRQLAEIDEGNLDVNLKLANLYLIADNHDYVNDQLVKLEKIAKNHPDVIAFKAESEFRYGDIAKAELYARQVLALDAKNSSAYMTLAKIAGKNEDYVGALKIIDDAIDKNPTNNSLYLAKVSLLQDSNLPEHMPDVYRKLIQINPEKFEYKKELALLYVRLSQYSQAELLLKETLKHDPKNIESQMGLVRLTNATVGKKQAKRLLDQFVKDSPESMSLKFAQYGFLREEGDYEQSIAILKDIIAKAHELDDKYQAMAIMADALLEQGWHDEAVKLVDEALAKDPKNSHALLVRAKLYMYEEKFNSAIGVYRNILDDFPTSVPAMIGLGKAYEQSEAIELANESYYQAFKSSPGVEEIKDGYIQFLLKNQLKLRAEQVLEELSHRSPGNMLLRKQLVLLKAENGNFEDAHKVALEMTRIPKMEALGAQANGYVYLSEKKYDLALQAFNQALAFDPLRTEFVVDVVNTYDAMGQTTNALKYIESAITNHPQSIGLKHLKMKLLFSTKSPDAISYAQSVIKHPEAISDNYVLLANHFLSVGDYANAEQLLASGTQRFADSVLLLSALADVAIKQKQYSRAIQIFDNLLRKHPDDVIIKNNLAELLLDYAIVKRDSNRGYYLSRTFATSDLPLLRDTVAWALFKQGKPHQAIAILKEIIKQSPLEPVFYEHLIKVYNSIGQVELAKQIIKKAREAGINVNMLNLVS